MKSLRSHVVSVHIVTHRKVDFYYMKEGNMAQIYDKQYKKTVFKIKNLIQILMWLFSIWNIKSDLHQFLFVPLLISCEISIWKIDQPPITGGVTFWASQTILKTFDKESTACWFIMNWKLGLVSIRASEVSLVRWCWLGLWLCQFLCSF